MPVIVTYLNTYLIISLRLCCSSILVLPVCVSLISMDGWENLLETLDIPMLSTGGVLQFSPILWGDLQRGPVEAWWLCIAGHGGKFNDGGTGWNRWNWRWHTWFFGAESWGSRVFSDSNIMQNHASDYKRWFCLQNCQRRNGFWNRIAYLEIMVQTKKRPFYLGRCSASVQIYQRMPCCFVVAVSG